MNSPFISPRQRRTEVLELQGLRVLKQTKTPNTQRLIFRLKKWSHKIRFILKGALARFAPHWFLVRVRAAWAWLAPQPLIVWLILGLGFLLVIELPILEWMCNIFLPLPN